MDSISIGFGFSQEIPFVLSFAEADSDLIVATTDCESDGAEGCAPGYVKIVMAIGIVVMASDVDQAYDLSTTMMVVIVILYVMVRYMVQLIL